MNASRYYGVVFGGLLLAAAVIVIALPYSLQPQHGASALPPPAPEKTRPQAAMLASKTAQQLLAMPDKRPASSLLAAIAADDAPALLAAYEQAADLRQRRGLAWALGYLGSPEAAAMLIRSLTRDFAARQLSEQEEDILLEHLLALGFAAERADAAFAFLRQACESEFWQKARTWRSGRGQEGERLPVSYALQGLGLSGRSEAEDILKSCRQRDAVWLYWHASSVAQGMFYLAMRSKHGAERFRHDFTGLNSWQRWEEWASGPGQEWTEWANACRRGKLIRE